MRPIDMFRMIKYIHIGQYRILNVFFFALSFFCMFTSVLLLFNPKGTSIQYYLITLVPLTYFAVMPLTFFLLVRSLYSKQDFLSKPILYQLDDEGILSKNEQFQGKTNWTQITKLAETRDDFIFFVARAQAFSIPKQALGAREKAFQHKTAIQIRTY